MKSLIISLFIVAVASCNTKTTEEVANITETKVEEKQELEDCLTESVSVTEVTDETGKVVRVQELLMIAFGTSSRVNPCNLPSGYIPGQKVKFSGSVKQAPEGVRLMGTPFVLTAIEKM